MAVLDVDNNGALDEYDIGMDEYPGAYLTPTPTHTPLPTPTPFVHSTFDTGDDVWQFCGEVYPYDMLTITSEGGHLGLNAQGSTNCSFHWYSPDVQEEDGKLYRARWIVESNTPSPISWFSSGYASTSEVAGLPETV